MKKIEISGKHNKDRIKKAMDPNTIAIRECMENIPQLSFIEQKTMINQKRKLQVFSLVDVDEKLVILTLFFGSKITAK